MSSYAIILLHIGERTCGSLITKESIKILLHVMTRENDDSVSPPT